MSSISTTETRAMGLHSRKVLVALVVVFLGIAGVSGLFFLRSEAFLQSQVRNISIEEGFGDILVPEHSNTVAYSLNLKDRYTWGRIIMPKSILANFIRANGLEKQMTREPKVVKSVFDSMTRISTLLTRADEAWIPLGFQPREAVRFYSRKIVIGELVGPEPNRCVVLLFQSD